MNMEDICKVSIGNLINSIVEKTELAPNQGCRTKKAIN